MVAMNHSYWMLRQLERLELKTADEIKAMKGQLHRLSDKNFMRLFLDYHEFGVMPGNCVGKLMMDEVLEQRAFEYPQDVVEPLRRESMQRIIDFYNQANTMGLGMTPGYPDLFKRGLENKASHTLVDVAYERDAAEFRKQNATRSEPEPRGFFKKILENQRDW